MRIGQAAVTKASGAAETQTFGSLRIHVERRRDQPFIRRGGVAKAIAFDIFVAGAATEPGVGRVGVNTDNRPAGGRGRATVKAFAQGEGLARGYIRNRSW